MLDDVLSSLFHRLYIHLEAAAPEARNETILQTAILHPLVFRIQRERFQWRDGIHFYLG